MYALPNLSQLSYSSMCFQDHMHAPHCCQHYSPKTSLWSSYIYVNHILKKKKITQKHYSRRHSPIILLIILLSPQDSMDQPTFPPHPCTPTNLPEVVWDQRQAKDPGHWDLSAIGHATGLKTVKWITWMAPYGSVKVHPWDLLSKRSRKTLSTHWCKFQGPLRLVYLLTFLQRIQQRHRKTRAHR